MSAAVFRRQAGVVFLTARRLGISIRTGDSRMTLMLTHTRTLGGQFRQQKATRRIIKDMVWAGFGTQARLVRWIHRTGLLFFRCIFYRVTAKIFTLISSMHTFPSSNARDELKTRLVPLPEGPFTTMSLEM